MNMQTYKSLGKMSKYGMPCLRFTHARGSLQGSMQELWLYHRLL